LINYYFDQDTVQEILKTPLFRQVEEDDLIWRVEKNGQYYVKSAYRLCMENRADNSLLFRQGEWSRIWKLKVPPKVKNLLWRICRGCLLTQARLLDKGVNFSSMCEESYEDTSHVMYDCPRARKVWQDCLLISKVNSVMLRNNTTAEIIFVLLQERSCVQTELFATVLWSLWKSRNLRLWQNVTETSQTILDRVRQLEECE